MAVVAPTITTDDEHEYREQLELIATFADGVHIDFADGIFAPSRLLPLTKAWRHDDLITHAHIMYQKPREVVDDVIALEADLVIIHVEADDVKETLTELQESGTRTGVAMLPETTVKELQELEIDDLFDHILVFSGHLGFQGGEADMSQTEKVKELKKAYPDVEIAWDGGINDDDIKMIAAAGVDILNVGGYIKNAKDPQKAYDTLVNLIQS